MAENIITWDFMGWQKTTAPDVGVQLNWNKTLLEKFTQISSQINRNSRRGGVDTYIHKDKRIESGEPFELMKGNKLVLATSDKLIVSSKVDSSLDVIFSILQGVS